jgi:hypothetical protein
LPGELGAARDAGAVPLANLAVVVDEVCRSAQSSTETTSESRISRPPMVGVPSFCWWSGPISRIGWPTRRRASCRINIGPTRKERKRAVKAAPAVRKVM